ncbi:MAG: hypothetical protein ACYC8T_29280 [Myxococcaceae bacterium]
MRDTQRQTLETELALEAARRALAVRGNGADLATKVLPAKKSA